MFTFVVSNNLNLTLMKTRDYLLPYPFKKIGAALLAVTAVFGLFVINLGGTLVTAKVPGLAGRFGIPGLDHGPSYELVCRQTDLDATLLILGFMLGLLFIALSREKIEDECMASIRAKAFSLALWASGILLLLSTLFSYDIIYLDVMIGNLFAFPAIFIVIQRVLVYRFKKQNSHEE